MSYVVGLSAPKSFAEFKARNEKFNSFGKKEEMRHLLAMGCEWTVGWKSRQEKQELPIKGATVFTHADYKDELPRTLLYDPADDQTYLLATRTRACGDPKLGEGKTSRVKLALAKEKVYAVSVTRFKRVSPHTKERIRNRDVMEQIRGASRLVQEKCRAETEEKLYSIREYGDCGDLFDAIFSGFIQSLPLQNQLFLIRDIFQGILQLHERGLIHRDMKGENIFLFEEEKQIRAKLGDFESICTEIDFETKKHFRGTCSFMSPELVSDPKNPEEVTTAACDMWALGCILFEFLNVEHLPWNLKNDKKTLEAIQSLRTPEDVLKQIHQKFNFAPHSHYGMGEVVLWLLHPDPKKRATAQQAYEQVCKICKIYGVI
jgi:serine/threonine protein kinase